MLIIMITWCYNGMQLCCKQTIKSTAFTLNFIQLCFVIGSDQKIVFLFNQVKEVGLFEKLFFTSLSSNDLWDSAGNY